MATRPITMTIAALGGQGGGVVTDWLVQAARSAGFFVQATSVPGVAQRTGATIYYLEFFPRNAPGADGREPIMALMPNPGDVDIVVASEWMEAGRAINRGLVTKDRTTLIASTHRDYTIGEKMALGDGRSSSRELYDIALANAAKLITFDMASVAKASSGHISAVIFGSISGSGVLPWDVSHYHQAIRESGVGVEASLKAFDAGRSAVITAQSQPAMTTWPGDRDTADAPAYSLDSAPAKVRNRIVGRFPAPLHELLGMGAARLVDYQDEAYAEQFLDRAEGIFKLEPAANGDAALTAATARSLALWMSFEDVMRVAQVKTRRGRAQRIRTEVRAGAGDLVQVREYVKPRVEEICGTLPAGLGRRLLASPRAHRFLSKFTAGRRISTSTVTGFLMLCFMSALRRSRRSSLRFVEENGRIEAWLAQIAAIAPRDYPMALELAECQNLVKGYGDTHERGWASFTRIAALASALAGTENGAAQVRAMRDAALADDSGQRLQTTIAQMNLGLAA
jgi:indolepyruvate ferredoxin oxidoreductase, beta subunit